MLLELMGHCLSSSLVLSGLMIRTKEMVLMLLLVVLIKISMRVGRVVQIHALLSSTISFVQNAC